MTRLVCLAQLLLLATFSSNASAETWPQFRGSRGTGVSSETNLPKKWSNTSGIKWSVGLGGQGNSSPAVSEKFVAITTQMKDESLWVLTFDRATGNPLQEIKVGKGKLAAKGPANLYAHRHNAATPTPIVEGNNIWAFFGTGLLVRVDAAKGKVLWSKDLVKDYGAYDITFGMGSTPRLWGDLLYVACMTKGASYVVALDKNSGDEAWKVDRRFPAADDGPDAYSTPAILNTNGKDELVVVGCDHVNAYNLKTGKQNWAAPGLTIDSPYGRVIASAVGANGVVIATSGNPGGGGKGHVLGISSKKSGLQAKDSHVWRYAKTTPDSSSPVVYDGKVFMITDQGVGSCLDLQTGKVDWQKRIGKGPYHAAAIAADGHIYFSSASGNTDVVSTDGTAVNSNQLDGQFYATPAIADGVIFLRAYEKLYAIE